MSGRIYGRAGTSLGGDTRWATNAGTLQAGFRGEARTEALLNELARDTEATVLHDVRIPIPGWSINIDHIVIAGQVVLLIDSKAWKPGFLWTWGSRTRRGTELFPACDKRTVQMAAEAFQRYLSMTGARFAQPVVVVWSSRHNGKVSTWAAKFPGARLIGGQQLPRTVRRSVPVKKQADPDVVSRLLTLVA